MKMVRTGSMEVRCYLDVDYLKKFGLELEIFRDHKPFPDAILRELLAIANDKYGLEFDVETETPREISVVEDTAVIVFEKSNVIHLPGEEFEEFEILSGIRQLFRELPDEKINMGVMKVEEKQRILEEIRNDDSMAYLRKEFVYYE